MRSFFELPALLALALLIQHHPAASGKEPPQEPLVRDDDGAIIFQVAGGFRSTQAAAKESALLEAQLQMRWWLRRQELPIRHAPSIEMIRRKLIVQEDTPAIETVSGEKQYKISITVFLNSSTIRELRAADRVVSTAWWIGSVMGILALIALVLRLDEWTKGYLTRWLVVGAAGFGLAVGLLLWWAK